jgi:hypothetical protein
MPYPFQPVTPRPNDYRGLLAAFGPVLQGSQIIGKYLNGVQEIIQVLDFRNRPQTS